MTPIFHPLGIGSQIIDTIEQAIHVSTFSTDPKRRTHFNIELVMESSLANAPSTYALIFLVDNGLEIVANLVAVAAAIQFRYSWTLAGRDG